MDKKNETINTYNKSAVALAKKFNELGGRVKDIERAFFFLKKENPKVLEIGCGNGRDAKEILRRTKDYLGIDISKELVRLAKDYVPEAHFELEDIENFSFPKKIDIIFAFASLLHTNKENIKNILIEAHGALNTNGIFLISLKFGDYREETKTDEFGTRTFYFYTPELIIELAGSGYKVVYQDDQDLRGQKWFTIIFQK